VLAPTGLVDACLKHGRVELEAVSKLHDYERVDLFPFEPNTRGLGSLNPHLPYDFCLLLTPHVNHSALLSHRGEIDTNPVTSTWQHLTRDTSFHEGSAMFSSVKILGRRMFAQRDAASALFWAHAPSEDTR
jgi:hypothetical protein